MKLILLILQLFNFILILYYSFNLLNNNIGTLFFYPKFSFLQLNEKSVTLQAKFLKIYL
jgi:hypothetical protein